MRIIEGKLLFAEMVKAAEIVLRTSHPEAHIFADGAFRKLSEVLVEIQTKWASGRITEDHARALLRIARNTSTSVLLAVSGITLPVAEQAMDAALNAVKIPINDVLRWDLI